MAKAFFIDTSRCTACRGCQVACKEWHGLPPVTTKQQGTHQNPPDLNPFNYKLVRFDEHKINGKVSWLFFPDQCRHCVEPPCKDTADSYIEGAIIVDEPTGAVIYTEKTKQLTVEQYEDIRESCPYNIPRRDEKTGLLSKCDMCIDRVQANMLPACVKTCCTGTMNFGDSQEMLDFANKRLAVLKESYPQAELVDEDSVGVVFLITHPRKMYSAQI
ncbi:Formate dehydrogenase subunit beta [uncultured Desulfobacterium sp.]|uniref:Formate dehydrogenase subunit beta n=1 Tax=uncultured Desulfobacterium sp. TaxID=201089 RepID=A0A445N2E7_9BACT|nr:Formate dehydrogenase subunit beta [uncultured Desulfobacterium sp.]